MDLRTVPGVEDYFRKNWHMLSEIGWAASEVQSVSRINEGITNYVYRVTFTDDDRCKTPGGARLSRTIMFKHASEYTTSEPAVKFPVSRQKFELVALELLPALLKRTSHNASITLPVAYKYDETEAVIFLEDIAPPSQDAVASKRKHTSLHHWLSNLASDGQAPDNIVDECREIGDSLGAWLANFHGLTARGELEPGMEEVRSYFEKNTHARDITLQTTYADVFPQLDKLGVKVGSAERARLQHIFQALVEDSKSITQPLIMGDFWAGNVVLTTETIGGYEKHKAIHVIDWEFASCGPACFDLAHFMAELWLDGRFETYRKPSLDQSPRRELMSSIISAYRASGGDIDLQSLIYYVSGHVCCFLGYAPRSTNLELKMKVAREALELALFVERGDWAALQHDFLIGYLL